MKKRIFFLNILLTLFLVGCSSADVDNVLSSVSNGIEKGVDNISGMIEKMKGDTPSSIKLPVPQNSLFRFEGYKMELKYVEKTGIEASLNGKLHNGTGKMLIVITEFPIYDLNGREVNRGYLKNYIEKNSMGQLYGNYTQYKLKKDLRILPEKVMTRVYANGVLIASTHKINSNHISKKATTPKEKCIIKEDKKVETVQETNVQPIRQTRQSIKK